MGNVWSDKLRDDSQNLSTFAGQSGQNWVQMVQGGLILYPGVSVMGGPLAVDFQYHCLVLYCIVQSSGMKP